MSVVIASYNHDNYVEATIRSIWKQTYQQIEIIVVDDCSTDRTYEILRGLKSQSSIPMKLYQNDRNIGPPRSINRAAELATGEYLSLMASDDMLVSGRFEWQVAEFQSDSELMVLFSNGWVLRDGKFVRRLNNHRIQTYLNRSCEDIRDDLTRYTNPLALQTTLIRRSFFSSIGGFDEDLLADDSILNIRMFDALRKHGKFKYVNRDSVVYRLHDTNLHQNIPRHARLKIQTIRKYCPTRLRRNALRKMYIKQAKRLCVSGHALMGCRFLLLSALYPIPVRDVVRHLCSLARRVAKANR